MNLEEKIVYFDLPGKDNTEETLRLALERAEKRGIKNVVVASTKGYTAKKAAELFKGFNLVIVTHSTGFKERGKNEFDEEIREKLVKRGIKVLTTIHALAGVDRAIRKRFDTICPVEIIAHTLRRFGEGMKVCVEISMMAADSGMIPVDEDVIAIAGTGEGADTALVIKPAYSWEFFNLKIKEIICKPLLK
ncbi:MAG: pyruvate kinase alpha/beta domain-containing protein [Candidatus Asgardarchaeia archaeon]